MYPSEKDPDYGVFIRNVQNSLTENGAEFSHDSLIKGRSLGFMGKLKKYLLFYSTIVKNYYFGNYDLIYIHFISHVAPVLWVLNLLSLKKRILVINVHGSDVLVHNKGILKIFIKSLINKADLVVVPSSYFEKVIKDLFPKIKPSKIYISPSGGIDSDIFYPKSIEKKNDILKLGFVSRIEEDKGWRILLNSLKIIKEKGISFQCEFIGKGSQVDELKTLIAEYDLSDQVQYVGLMNQKDLNKFYNSLDIFVFPTMRDSESLGLVGLEAMACGVPVIGSEIAGVATYLKDGENGFLFAPSNVEELVNCILKFNQLSESDKNNLREMALKTAGHYEKSKVSKELFDRFVELNDSV